MLLNVTRTLMSGLATTFQIFFFTLIFSLPLGLLLAFGTISKCRPLSYLIQLIVWIIRGLSLIHI